MAHFGFIHLSDLHFSTIPLHINELSNDRRSLLYKVAWVIEAKRNSDKPWRHPTTFEPDVASVLARDLAKKVKQNQIDGILVTGDLATTGFEEDLKVAKSFFCGKLSANFSLPDLAGGLENLMEKVRVIALPGNHDRYADKWCFPRSNVFEKQIAFHETWDCGHGWAKIPDSSRLRYSIVEKESEKIIFIQVDLSLECYGDASSAFGILGQGNAYRNAVKALKSLTLKLSVDHMTQAIVWLCHFPPEYDGGKESLELIYGRRLSKAAEECGVRYILAGHIHSACTYNPPTSPRTNVICSGSATDPEGVPSYNGINFQVSAGQIIQCSWDIYDYDRGDFVKRSRDANPAGAPAVNSHAPSEIRSH